MQNADYSESTTGDRQHVMKGRLGFQVEWDALARISSAVARASLALPYRRANELLRLGLAGVPQTKNRDETEPNEELGEVAAAEAAVGCDEGYAGVAARRQRLWVLGSR